MRKPKSNWRPGPLGARPVGGDSFSRRVRSVGVTSEMTKAMAAINIFKMGQSEEVADMLGVGDLYRKYRDSR
jgi:hypothetical protein